MVETKSPKNGLTRIGFSIAEAGEMLGLGRQASYRAAKRGDIPTIRMGRKLIVPKAPFYKKFGLEITAPGTGGAAA